MMEKEKLISTVIAAQNGEEAAITALYETFQGDIYYHILKNVDNDSELAADLTQETFIEILETIGDLKEPAAFVTWSQRIAYHKCTAYFRKRREILADEDADGHTVFDTMVEDRTDFIPGEALDKEDLKRAIQGIIDQLPPEQRSAIMLRYFNEISVKEIADIQGVSEGTVKSRLNYGRKTIKEEVEKYEKKHDIKLHCAGVIPLLLWLLREYKLSNGISLTASVTVPVAETAVLASGAAATTTATTATSAAGGLLAKNVIAIAIATSLAIGGVTAGVLLWPEDTKPTISSTEPTQAITTDPTTVSPTESVTQLKNWYGYEEATGSQPRRIDFTVEEMSDTYIKGTLVSSILFETKHTTSFEGLGSLVDGNIQYDIVFESPADSTSTFADYYSKITAIYDKAANTIQLKGCYSVTLGLMDYSTEPILAQNAKWSGIGQDDTSYGIYVEGHLFELDINKMTEAEIFGKLTVSKDGTIKHESTFYGRGYRKNKEFCYEVKLDTPREVENIGTRRVDFFWLDYLVEEDVFSFRTGWYYAEMDRQ